MPVIEPGVSWSSNAGTAAPTSSAPPISKKAIGRRMILPASLPHSPSRVSLEPLRRGTGILAKRKPP
jgi:hypothetical protein